MDRRIQAGHPSSRPREGEARKLDAAGKARIVCAVRRWRIVDCRARRASLTSIRQPRGSIASPIRRTAARVNILNDGRCDRRGRFWVGSMSKTMERASGCLYRLERGHLEAADDGIWVANGVCWSPDDTRMYFADSHVKTIFVYDFDLAAGMIGPRRVFTTMADRPGVPDGSSVDTEGFIWNAIFDGGCVVRYAPDGRVDRTVPFAGQPPDRLHVRRHRPCDPLRHDRALSYSRPTSSLPKPSPVACWRSMSGCRVCRNRFIPGEGSCRDDAKAVQGQLLVDVGEHDLNPLANLNPLGTGANDVRGEPWSLVQLNLHDVVRRISPKCREPCLVNGRPGADAPRPDAASTRSRRRSRTDRPARAADAACRRHDTSAASDDARGIPARMARCPGRSGRGFL